MHSDTSPRWSLQVLAVVSVVFVLQAAFGSRAAADSLTHVRGADAEMGRLIAEGARRSPSLQSLLERLDASNVFIYVERGSLPLDLNGRLHLLDGNGPYRYARIQIERRLMIDDQIATLGHELQHAVEIASAPSTVDQASVQQLYESIGFAHDVASTGFETDAAKTMGRRVLRELLAPGSNAKALIASRDRAASEAPSSATARR